MPATAPKFCIEVLEVCAAIALAALVFGLWWRLFNKTRGTEITIFGAAKRAVLAMREDVPADDIRPPTPPTVTDGNPDQLERLGLDATSRKDAAGRELAKLARQGTHCRRREEELARRYAVARAKASSHTARLDSLARFSLLEMKEKERLAYVHVISSDSEDSENGDENFSLEARSQKMKGSPCMPSEKKETTTGMAPPPLKGLIENEDEKEALSPTPEQDLDDPENMSEASRAKSSRGIPAVASVKGNGIGIEDEEDNNKIAEMGSRFLPKDAGPRDQNGEVENALRGMLVAPVLDTPVQDKTKYALRRKEGIAEDGFEEVMPGAGDGRRQRSAEVLTGLAKEVRDWSPGAIRELFIANLDRGGFGNKTAVAKTALGRRSQEPPFVKLEVLGVGKFGTVVCVRHKLFGVEYALKTVVEGANGQTRFCAIVEMLVLARLALRPHNNIISAEAMDDSHPMMPLLLPKAMGDLFTLMERGNYSSRDQLRLIVNVTEGALHMHGMGLVHKDIKPENVLIFKDERLGEHAKLVDFGFTRGETLTTRREAGVKCPGVMGTPGYLPLECLISDNVTCHASQDVFAVAVLLLLVCVKSPMMRSNMFCHEALFTDEERTKRDHLEELSQGANALAEIAVLEMEVAKRTMTDGSFHEVILAVDMMDDALTAREEVCKGLPFFLTTKQSERRDMASLREFVVSLEERQLDVL